MRQSYQILGMTCSSCELTVKKNLLDVSGVTNVVVSKDTNSGIITMVYPIDITKLQMALGGLNAKYQIKEIQSAIITPKPKSWFLTYKPILLVFAFILGVTLLVEFNSLNPNSMRWMTHFMSAFFIVFSFFKLLDIKGFASGYAMYDVLAKRFKPWGYIYPFVELVLGLAFLLKLYPLMTNLITLIVMTISIIGVLISVLNKQTIKCACLGSVFNLPMSTLTIIEDGIMILMSFYMLINLIN